MRVALLAPGAWRRWASLVVEGFCEPHGLECMVCDTLEQVRGVDLIIVPEPGVLGGVEPGHIGVPVLHWLAARNVSVRAAMERARREGRTYTKPSLLHWLALYLSGKPGFSHLTVRDLERAEDYFYTRYTQLYEKGNLTLRELHRKFLENEAPLLSFIASYKAGQRRADRTLGREKRYNRYTGLTAFYMALRRTTSRHRQAK